MSKPKRLERIHQKWVIWADFRKSDADATSCLGYPSNAAEVRLAEYGTTINQGKQRSRFPEYNPGEEVQRMEQIYQLLNEEQQTAVFCYYLLPKKLGEDKWKEITGYKPRTLLDKIDSVHWVTVGALGN